MFKRCLAILLIVFGLGLWGCVPSTPITSSSSSTSTSSSKQKQKVVYIDTLPKYFSITQIFWLQFAKRELPLLKATDKMTRSFNELCDLTMLQMYKHNKINLSDKIYQVAAANNIVKVYIFLAVLGHGQKCVLSNLMSSDLWWKVQPNDPYLCGLLGWTMAELSMIKFLCNGHIPPKAYTAVLLTLDIISQYPLTHHTGADSYMKLIWPGMDVINKLYTKLAGHSLFPKQVQKQLPAASNGISL